MRRRGVEILAARLFENSGVEVVYTPHDEEPVECIAIRGYNQAVVEEDTDFHIGGRDRDFLIRAVDLPRAPQQSDKILVVETGRIHDVSKYNSEPCWRWSDPFEQVYRIHAKEIK